MMREILRAACVIARRDFVAVIFSKAFLFFLIGPLFPVAVGAMAGIVGAKAHRDFGRPQLGVAMAEPDLARLMNAERDLVPRLGEGAPTLVVLKALHPQDRFDPRTALGDADRKVGAVLTGPLSAPVLTGPREQIERWQGPVSVIAGRALASQPGRLPDVTGDYVAASAASRHGGQLATAQVGQVALFLVTVMLAGMVLSNLVEEKGNKIIEVLAAAVPMDGLFLGKLFAMLGVSLIAVAVWGAAWGLLVLTGGQALPQIPVPAVGWPAFLTLAFLYFAMAYLLLGSTFLAVGGLANTVRDVQTLSMPVTMAQLMVFFFASYALSQIGSPVEWAAVVVPFSSPYAMLARAAQEAALWPHLLALGWQALWVTVFIRGGAHLFRRAVLKSGPARGKSRKAKAA